MSLQISLETCIDIIDLQFLCLDNSQLVARFTALIKIHCVLFDSENVGKMSHEFLVGFPFLGWRSNSHANVLLIDLYNFALLAIRFRRDDQGKSFLMRQNALGNVFFLDDLWFCLLLLGSLHGDYRV